MADVEFTRDMEVAVVIPKEEIAASPHLQRQIKRIQSDATDRMRAFDGLGLGTTDRVKDLRAKPVEDLGTEK